MRLTKNIRGNSYHLLSLSEVKVFFDEIDDSFLICLKYKGVTIAILKTELEKEFKKLWSESK